jgi:hypothetical protein
MDDPVLQLRSLMARGYTINRHCQVVAKADFMTYGTIIDDDGAWY